jgi:hypothetical protein
VATRRRLDARKQIAANSNDVAERDTTYPVSSIEVTAREKDMNAPPKIDTVSRHSDGDVVHWLMNDTRDERFIDNIFAELCIRLQRAGIPVKRSTLHILVYHPQWLGARQTARWGR